MNISKQIKYFYFRHQNPNENVVEYCIFHYKIFLIYYHKREDKSSLLKLFSPIENILVHGEIDYTEHNIQSHIIILLYSVLL